MKILTKNVFCILIETIETATNLRVDIRRKVTSPKIAGMKTVIILSEEMILKRISNKTHHTKKKIFSKKNRKTLTNIVINALKAAKNKVSVIALLRDEMTNVVKGAKDLIHATEINTIVIITDKEIKKALIISKENVS